MNRTIFFNAISNPIRLLETCSSMDQFKQIHAQAVTLGLARFTYITSKLLAFCIISDIDYAHSIFNQINLPTIFDYNSMIMGYPKTSKQEMGISLYTQMQSQGLEPNAFTFPVLIKSCGCSSSLCQVHGQVVKLGNVSDVYVISSLVRAYAKYEAIEVARQVFEESSYRNVVCYTSLITGFCGNGLVDDALKLFEKMSEKNEVSYSAMISGFVRNERFNEAIELYRQLKNSGEVKPNRSLLTRVLRACGAVGALQEGRTVHYELSKDFFDNELQLGTALLDFYAKCGDIDTARKLFSEISRKDVTTWSAMILGLAVNGKNEMAIELFKEMEEEGPIPNDITFVGVLIACNHKTLFKGVWKLFSRMSKVYGVSPSVEHYGCMVDILARSGQLKQAEILIKLMPMEPDGVIWGSFLNGCLTHGETRLAEKAGKLLIELEPQASGRYVLLSNVYATMGSWEGVIKFRNMMKDRKVVPAPAWSFIEVDGVVHKFFADDKNHPQATDIYKLLREFNEVLVLFCE